MLTLALIFAFWLAAAVAVCVAFSWIKRAERRREQAQRRLVCTRNHHRSALKPDKLVCDCGAISRNRVPWLDRDEEFWTDDEDELTEGERQEVRRSYGVEDFPWPKGGER